MHTYFNMLFWWIHAIWLLSGLFLHVLTVHIHCPYPGFAHSSTPKPVAREKTGALWDLAVQRDQWVSQQRWVTQERKDGWSGRVATRHAKHEKLTGFFEITSKHESSDRTVHVRLLRVWLLCCFVDLGQAIRVQRTWYMRYLWAYLLGAEREPVYRKRLHAGLRMHAFHYPTHQMKMK